MRAHPTTSLTGLLTLLPYTQPTASIVRSFWYYKRFNKPERVKRSLMYLMANVLNPVHTMVGISSNPL